MTEMRDPVLVARTMCAMVGAGPGLRGRGSTQVWRGILTCLTLSCSSSDLSSCSVSPAGL
jgi:hypothetical protein